MTLELTAVEAAARAMSTFPVAGATRVDMHRNAPYLVLQNGHELTSNEQTKVRSRFPTRLFHDHGECIRTSLRRKMVSKSVGPRSASSGAHS